MRRGVHSKAIIVDHVGPVQLIAINRPEKKNAIDYRTSVELLQTVKQFDEDENSKVAVLYGKGEFCNFICATALPLILHVASPVKSPQSFGK